MVRLESEQTTADVGAVELAKRAVKLAPEEGAYWNTWAWRTVYRAGR